MDYFHSRRLNAEKGSNHRIPDGRIMRVDPVYQGVYLFSLDARYLLPRVYILVISAEHAVRDGIVTGSTVVTILRE